MLEINFTIFKNFTHIFHHGLGNIDSIYFTRFLLRFSKLPYEFMCCKPNNMSKRQAAFLLPCVPIFLSFGIQGPCPWTKFYFFQGRPTWGCTRCTCTPNNYGENLYFSCQFKSSLGALYIVHCLGKKKIRRPKISKLLPHKNVIKFDFSKITPPHFLQNCGVPPNIN